MVEWLRCFRGCVTNGDREVLSVQQILYGRKGFRVREEHEPYLDAVERAARDLEQSRNAVAAAMCSAHEADVPFRAIAAAAGVSHEQARRIVKATVHRG
jgi:hypothetical protein